MRNIKELEILWGGERNGKQGYGRFQTTDNSFIITADGKVYDGNGEKAEIKVVKDVYSDNGQMTTEAVSGASVSVYDRKERKQKDA